MKRFSQTLRIGLALFLSVFGTSALPTASVYALDEGGGDQTQTEALPPPTSEATTPDTIPDTSSAPAELPPPPPPVVEETPATPPVPTQSLMSQENRVMPDQPNKPEVKEEELVQQVKPPEIDQTCDDITTPGSNGWTTKFDAGYPDTVLYTAPAGYLVDKYCVKAGSTQQGNGPLIVEVAPPASSVTIDYPNKDSISHYVVHLITAPKVTVNPVAPSVDDKCETKNDMIVLPTDTAQITYSLKGNVVTATLVNPTTHEFAAPLNGYVVAGDGLTASYTVTYEFTNVPCDEEVIECPKNTEWADINQNEKVDEGECFKKVWVCKYVGIPGINERLKQGNQGLVQVSVNAIEHNQWDGTIPGWFSDKQDRSYVIDFVDDKKDPPSAEDCPQMSQPSVTVLDTVCIEDGQTGSFTVRVANPNDYAIEYRVDADGGKSTTKIIAANSSADFTFSGYAAGTYVYEVFQKVAANDEYEEVSDFSRIVIPHEPVFQWQKIDEGEVTLVNCGRVLGETDVCPNLTGTQSSVPAGYKLMNGQCVVPETPQVLAAAVALPATLPATGASDHSSLYLVLGLVFSSLTYFAMLRRYQEA